MGTFIEIRYKWAVACYSHKTVLLILTCIFLKMTYIKISLNYLRISVQSSQGICFSFVCFSILKSGTSKDFITAIGRKEWALQYLCNYIKIIDLKTPFHLLTNTGDSKVYWKINLNFRDSHFSLPTPYWVCLYIKECRPNSFIYLLFGY